MSDSSPVVDAFYGLAEVAEGVSDDDVSQWLGALVLLLAEEIGEPERVVALATEAAVATASPVSNRHPNQEQEDQQ